MVIGFEIHAARGNKLSTLNIYGKKGGREGGGAGPGRGPSRVEGPRYRPHYAPLPLGTAEARRSNIFALYVQRLARRTRLATHLPYPPPLLGGE